MPLSLQDKLSCLRRELRIRRDTYPRLVARNVMAQDVADYQIGVMEAIVRDYEGHVAAAAGKLAVLPGEDGRCQEFDTL